MNTLLRFVFPSHRSVRMALGRAGLVGFAAVTVAGAATSPRATEVWVVTDQAHPVAGAADRRILLDAPAQLEAEIAAALPAEQAQATALVQERLKRGGVDLQRRMASAYQGVTDAWRLGVTKVPAVVVDRRYVVYGESDVAKAVARIAQHRQERP